MKFTSKYISLRNGDQIEIREVSEVDARELISIIKEYSEESEFIPTLKGEFNPTIEQEVGWIKKMNKQDNNLCLVATVNDKIIGNISINGSLREVMKHTAAIGMGLIKEHRNKGIGYTLMNEAIGWSKTNSILKCLYLETMSSNTVGISLYQKCGFNETGRKIKEIKRSNNSYLDTIIMYLDVNK